MEADSVAPPALTQDPPTPTTSARTAQPVAIAIWFRSPWKWFFSLGVGVTLLVVLTVASIIGTLYSPLERAQALVFYTWWYKLLLLALAVNMCCATVKTVMQKLLPTRELRVHRQRSFFDTAQMSARIPFRGEIADVARAFQAHGFKVRCEGDAGVARSGWWGRFGAPVSHVGLVIVLVAGFASSWVAREGLVQIPEGGSTSSMQMRPDLTTIQPLGFSIGLDNFSTGFFPRTRIPSHYTSVVTVRDGAELLYAGPVEVNHSPEIKGWRLHQTSYQELPTLTRHEVTIAGAALSEPVTIKVSPGQTLALPGSEDLTFTMDARMGWSIAKGTERVAGGSLMPGATEAKSLALLANSFEPDFVLGENRQITSRSADLKNPALNVTLLTDGKPAFTQWLFGREDMRGFSHAPSGPYKLTLVDVAREQIGYSYVVEVSDSTSGVLISRALLVLGQEVPVAIAQPEEADDAHNHDHDHAADAAQWTATLGPKVTGYATVLTLSRNPAIPTIYGGCILMMIGLIMAFFVPRRNVWFLRDPATGELRVVAHYRHPAERFDRATRAVLAKLAATATTSTPSVAKEL